MFPRKVGPDATISTSLPPKGVVLYLGGKGILRPMPTPEDQAREKIDPTLGKIHNKSDS